MTNDEAIAIIHNEYKCVDRDCDIERSCGKCDLMMPSKEPILEAYKLAIKALEQQPCDDVISRKAVFNAIEQEDKWLLFAKGHNGLTEIAFSGLKARVDALPSVTQKPIECDDTISREAVIEWLKAKDIIKLFSQEETARKELKALPPVTQKSDEQLYKNGFADGYEQGHKDAQQKYGKWIESFDIDDECNPFPVMKCSLCGKSNSWESRYCPNCGAKMIEPQESEE